MTDIQWVEAKQYDDITYHKADGIARIAFNRPEVRNAFRPQTIDEKSATALPNGPEKSAILP